MSNVVYSIPEKSIFKTYSVFQMIDAFDTYWRDDMIQPERQRPFHHNNQNWQISQQSG